MNRRLARRDPIGRFVEWMLSDRQTGDLVVGEAPNLPAAIATVSGLVRWVSPEGQTRSTASAVGTVAMVWWGAAEAASGANPFRRILGALALGAVLYSLLRQRD